MDILDKPRVYNKYNSPPKDAVYIGRGSKWGNPFIIGRDGTRDDVIRKFESEVLPTLDVSELRNKNLVCFCSPKPCHGDSIIRKANAHS